MTNEALAPRDVSAVKAEPTHSPWRAWRLVFVLTFLYCLSMLDRLILLLLVEPLSTKLSLTDMDVALLFGLGFGVVYTLVGLPLAQWIDRGNRILIIVGGVTLWSASTVASAFATSYEMLLLLRTGVAIGEAALSPAAISLIGDLFAPNKRTFPTSIYASPGLYMGPGAFVIGGAALALSTVLSPQIGLEPWSICLILVGLPGLIVAAYLAFFEREPARVSDGAQSVEAFSTKEAISYIAGNGRLWGMLFAAIALAAVANAGAYAWTSTLLIRGHGMEAAAAGSAYGAAGLMGAVIGLAFWPLVLSRFERKGRGDSLVLVLGAGLLIVTCGIVVIGLAQSVALLLFMVSVVMFGLTTMAILPPLIIQAVGAPRIRGRLVAGNLVASGLVGLVLGPSAVALIGEALEGPQALGRAMALVAGVLTPLVAGAVWLAHPPFVRAYRANAEARQ